MNTIQTIDRINQIKQLNALQAINKINPIQPISPINNKLKEVTDTVTSSLTDYNNPLEINSLSDALFNTDARKLKYGKATGTVLRAAWDHIKEHTIDPMLAGDWSTVGMNALTGFSEDMDLFARPFKALTIGGKEAAAQDRERNRSDYAGTIGGTVGGGVGAIAGAVIGSIFPGVGTAVGAALGSALGGTAGTLTGAISGEITDSFFADREPDNSKLVGRINYDYDTGNFFSDMALEIVSDPTGWVDIITDIATLGTSGAIKATSRTATKTVTKMATEAGESLSKQATKVIRQGIKRTLKQTTKEAAEASIRTVGDAVNLLKGTHAYKALSKEPLSDYTFKYISDLKLNKIISDDTIKLYNRTSTVLNTLDQISNGIEVKPFSKFDKAPAYFRNYKMKVGGIDPSRGLLKLSSLGNPISASAYLGSRFIKPLAGLGKSSRIKYLMTHTDGIDPKTGAINAEKYAKVFTTAATADAMFKLLFNETDSAPMNELIEKMSANSVNLIINKVKTLAEGLYDPEKTIIEQFATAQNITNYLDSVFGEKTTQLTSEELLRKLFSKYASGENLDLINDYIKVLASRLDSVRKEADTISNIKIKLEMATNTYNNYKTKAAYIKTLKSDIEAYKKSYNEYPLLKTLDYYKTIFNKHPLKFKNAQAFRELFKEIFYDIQLKHMELTGSVAKSYQAFKSTFLYKQLSDITLDSNAPLVLSVTDIQKLLKLSNNIDLEFGKEYLSKVDNVVTKADITLEDIKYEYTNKYSKDKSMWLYLKLYNLFKEQIDFESTDEIVNKILNKIDFNEELAKLKSKVIELETSLNTAQKLAKENVNKINAEDIIIRVRLDSISDPKEFEYWNNYQRYVKKVEGKYIDIKYDDLIFSPIKHSSDYYSENKIKNAIDTLLIANEDDYSYNAALEIVNELDNTFKKHPEQFMDLFDFVENKEKITISDIKEYPIETLIYNYTKDNNDLRSIVKRLNEPIEEKISRDIYDIRAYYAPQLRKYPEDSYEYHKIEIEMDAAIAAAMHRTPTTIDEYRFTFPDLSEKLQDIYNKYNLFKTKFYEAYKKAVNLDKGPIIQNTRFSVVKKITNDEMFKIMEAIDNLDILLNDVFDPNSKSILKEILNITEDVFKAKFKAGYDWETYSELFKNIIIQFKDARALQTLRDNIRSYFSLYLGGLSQTQVTTQVFINNVLSNLQHLYKTDSNLILACNTPEELEKLTGIYSNINAGLYSSQIDQRYTQEKVAKLLKIEYDGTLHTSKDDTELTEKIFNAITNKHKEIPEIIYTTRTEDTPKVFFDTETTGLRNNTDFREIYLKVEGADKGCMLYFDIDEMTFNTFSKDYKINLLQIPKDKVDTLTYQDWYKDYYLPTIKNNVKGTYREFNRPLSNLDNLLTLYDYLSIYAFKKGKIDFVPVGYNSNKFDNIRIYNLIERTLNEETSLTVETKLKLDTLRKLFSPNNDQMKNAIDVYQLFLQWDQGILQLNSSMKWEILNLLKTYINEKGSKGAAFGFHIYTLNHNLITLKEFLDVNKLDSTVLDKIISNNVDVLKNSYKQIYIELPKNYEVVINPDTEYEKTFISLESALSARNISSDYSIISETTKNILNDDVYKFFKADPEGKFVNEVIASTYHNRKPYLISKKILGIADGYRYTGCLKNPDVIAELKKAFALLTEIDEKTKKPILGKAIPFITYMKEADDPVELMAQVYYLIQKDYDPNNLDVVNQSVISTFKKMGCDKLAEIYENGYLYRKSNTDPILYNADKQIIQDSLNISNEIDAAKEYFKYTTEGTESLSSRRYLTTASQLAALNERINETIDILKEIKDSNVSKSKYLEYQERYQKEIYDNTITSISNLTNEQLTTFYLQQGRVIAFEADSTNDELNALLKRLESNKNFIVVLEELENGDSIYWTALKKSVQSFYSSRSGKYRLSKFGKELEPVNIDLGSIELDHFIKETDDELLSKLISSQKSNIEYFNIFIDDNNSSGYVFNPKGVITSEARYSSIFDKIPKELSDELPTKEVLLSPKNINWSNPFNLSFNLIGSDNFKKLHFGLQDPTDLFSSYYQAIRTVIQKQTTKQQVGSIFESALGFTSFNKFSNPDFDIVKAREMANYAAENPEYRLYARVIYQNKQGKTIDKIITLPNSEYTIMEVFNKGYTVSLETVQNGSIMMDVFNYKIDNSVFNTANLILRLFKITTLASTGSIMRNALDSYLKNVEDMGVVNATVNTYKAMVIKHNWHKCYKEILLNSQYEINLINPKWWENSVHLYFNGAERHGIDELTFMYLYSFFNDGPSSAILQDLEMVKNYRTAYTFGTGKATATVPNLKKWYNTNKKTINPKTFEKQNEEFVNKLFSTLIAPNIYIEQVNRLAMFLKYTEDGYLNTTQIYKKIANTHFDFTYKNNLHKTIELLIPFYSFTKDNALFWLRVAENNPIFFKRLIDMMTPVMDLDDYTRDELERNKSLVNQIRTGQIKIMPDADLTLKMNPSFLDVMNIFTNPVEALEQRLVSPAALALKHAEQFIVQNQYGGYTIDNGDILNMLPAIGTANVRYEAAKRNLERIDKKQNLTDTQKLAAKPFAAISSTFGVTQRYPIYKYETDRYYSTRSSQYYKNNTTLYKSGISSRPKKIYYPMEKPTQYSSSYYKFLYIKSLQRYFNT